MNLFFPPSIFLAILRLRINREEEKKQLQEAILKTQFNAHLINEDILKRAAHVTGLTGFTVEDFKRGSKLFFNQINNREMNRQNTDNHMIDGDDGTDFRSPWASDPDDSDESDNLTTECSVCEGAGRVSVRDKETGEYHTQHCHSCRGEGFTE